MFCQASRQAIRVRTAVQAPKLQFHSVSLSPCEFPQAQLQCHSHRLYISQTRPSLVMNSKLGITTILSNNHHQSCGITIHRQLSTSTRLLGLKHFELNAGPYGHLQLITGGDVSTQIKCLDPQKYPLQDKVLISVQSDEGVSLDEGIVQLKQDNNNLQLIIRNSGVGNKISCLTDLPLKFDIEANIKDDGEVSVQTFENDDVNISIQDGSCKLKNIQTGTVSLATVNGGISCDGVVQGNTSIKSTGSGNVKVHRIQGLSFSVETTAGDVEAKALYTDDSKITTVTGNIHIGSCHRQCIVAAQQSGDIKIDSLDGDISIMANKGDVTIGYIARHEDVNIETVEGNVDLKLSDSSKTNIDLEASELSLSNDFDIFDSQTDTHGGKTHLTGLLVGGAAEEDKHVDLLGKTQRSLVVRSGNGHVNLSCADWFSSLKLVSNVD